MPTHALRVRQPHKTKEPLCGIQSANLSLVIVVFCFPSCSAVLLSHPWTIIRRFTEKIFDFCLKNYLTRRAIISESLFLMCPIKQLYAAVGIKAQT